MRSCDGCETVVMTSETSMRGGKRLCAACRGTQPRIRAKRGGYVSTGRPTPTEREQARVAAELERFDSMAARVRAELGLQPMHHDASS